LGISFDANFESQTSGVIHFAWIQSIIIGQFFAWTILKELTSANGGFDGMFQ